MQKRINLLTLLLVFGSSSLFAQTRSSAVERDFERPADMTATSLILNEIKAVETNDDVRISSLYPNPATEYFVIRGETATPCDDCLQITLHHGISSEVMLEERRSFEQTLEQQFPLDGIPGGTHYLTVQTTDGRFYTVLPLVVRK